MARNGGPSRPSTEAETGLSHRRRRAGALLDACHELVEPLTALTNYLEVARRLTDEDAEIGAVRIAEILDKMSAQAGRAGQTLARLRRLLQGGPAERPTGAEEEAAGHPHPVEQPGGTPQIRDYRVNFINQFASADEVFRVCQRSIVIRRAGSPEEACEAAKARFAELENVLDWRIHAAAVEVVPLSVQTAPELSRRHIEGEHEDV